jgi:hypothetical protein
MNAPNNKGGGKSGVIEAELARIHQQHGKLTAEIVVEAARDKRSALHSCFTWDDTLAAEEWRKEQARRLIQSHVAVERVQDQRSRPAVAKMVEVRQYISAQPGYGYRSRDQVKNDAELREAFVKQKRSDLLGWCGSVVDFQEFDDVRSAIERLI